MAPVVMVNELFCFVLFCFGLPAGLVRCDCLVLDRLNFPLNSTTTEELETFVFFAKLVILGAWSCFAFSTSIFQDNQ
jgi:hypothetical protein